MPVTRTRDIKCGHSFTDQFSSVAQSCLTICDPMDCSMLGLPVHHQLLEFTQPTRYSCMENPMDRGAWWAAVMGSLRVGHDWATSLSLFTFMHWRRKWQPTPVFLPGESQGLGSLVGCCLWGHTGSDTTEATWRQQQHVHWVGDAIQPSHPLLSPSPLTLNLSQHQGLFKWVSSSNQVVKVLEFQLQHQPFQWLFKIDFP